jgi:phosphoglycerate dehydrogenase-like enzyme
LLPFVHRVVGYDLPGIDPHPAMQISSNLHATLAAAQLVTLHLPLTPQTRHIIGASELAVLPEGSVLVNVSRGGLVEEVALADALRSGHLAGAALDVFETEPLPPDSPLRDAPNLVLSPHIAWYSSQSGPRLGTWTVADVLGVLGGGRPSHGRIASRTGSTSRIDVA